MLENITLEKLTDYLGNDYKKQGNELVWQCPICNDTHRDNLKYNKKKNVLTCFADHRHAGMILSDILKANRDLYQKDKKPTLKLIVAAENKNNLIYTEEMQEKFILYMCACNETLLNHNKSLEFLYKKRGINKNTVEFTGLGIDLKKRVWVIPTLEYLTNKIIGFEYRPSDLSKKGLHREKGMPINLAEINCYTPSAEVLAILEGYFDCYVFYQFLKDKKQADYYHICTPSNGANSLIKQIKSVDFTKYKKFILFLDNDETGQKIGQQIKNEYPIFEIYKTNCKDFNDYYLNYIKNGD